jgi:hypothetical protein
MTVLSGAPFAARSSRGHPSVVCGRIPVVQEASVHHAAVGISHIRYHLLAVGEKALDDPRHEQVAILAHLGHDFTGGVAVGEQYGVRHLAQFDRCRCRQMSKGARVVLVVVVQRLVANGLTG